MKSEATVQKIVATFDTQPYNDTILNTHAVEDQLPQWF